MIKIFNLPLSSNRKTCVVNSDNLRQSGFVHSITMRTLWMKGGVLGSLSMAFGSMFWSQKNTESDQVASSCTSTDTNQSSPYELKLVQVLFRHGARTPLNSIPDGMEVKFCVFI